MCSFGNQHSATEDCLQLPHLRAPVLITLCFASVSQSSLQGLYWLLRKMTEKRPEVWPHLCHPSPTAPQGFILLLLFLCPRDSVSVGCMYTDVHGCWKGVSDPLKLELQETGNYSIWVLWNSRKQSVSPCDSSVALLSLTQLTPDELDWTALSMRLGVNGLEFSTPLGAH